MATRYVVKCVEDCNWVASLYESNLQFTKMHAAALSFERRNAEEVAALLKFKTKKTYILEDA